MHCQEAPCIDSCPVRAIYRRADGVVLINEDRCNGCGECILACPYDVLSLNRGIAPCKAVCPIGQDVQGYVALIAEGKFEEALELVRETNPLPGICGRICAHPCEVECLRGKADEPIAIADLKRFVADYELKVGTEEITPASRTREERVAVIGSGPAGLAAAHGLVNMGYGVTIFEALPVAGGMLALGVPEYRLPEKILQTEIDRIQKRGVEIKLNSPLGNELTTDDLQKQGYKAVFLAVGAHRSLKLGIPGEEMEDVYQGISFLKDADLGKEVKVGERVVVIGGGNVAVDVAMTALRLGAKEVQLVCLESREEMPAFAKEIQEALDEGVEINVCCGPKRIVGDKGKVTGVELIRCVSVFDKEGRFSPCYDDEVTRAIDADTVIVAIGQAPDLTFLPEDSSLKTSNRGTIEVDSTSLATNIPGVFAGGDATVPATLVEAIAAGKRAAISIDSYLRGESLPPEEQLPPTVTIDEAGLGEVERKRRTVMPKISPSEQVESYNEISLGLSQEMAVEEANRCLKCRGIVQKCTLCSHRIDQGLLPFCAKECVWGAIHFGDIGDPQSEVSQLIASRQGYVLRPEEDTQPSVHYLTSPG
jgi:NADPH-dependent glutamate synthase beta subunit-like oxidoreductase